MRDGDATSDACFRPLPLHRDLGRRRLCAHLARLLSDQSLEPPHAPSCAEKRVEVDARPARGAKAWRAQTLRAIAASAGICAAVSLSDVRGSRRQRFERDLKDVPIPALLAAVQWPGLSREARKLVRAGGAAWQDGCRVPKPGYGPSGPAAYRHLRLRVAAWHHHLWWVFAMWLFDRWLTGTAGFDPDPVLVSPFSDDMDGLPQGPRQRCPFQDL